MEFSRRVMGTMYLNLFAVLHYNLPLRTFSKGFFTQDLDVHTLLKMKVGRGWAGNNLGKKVTNSNKAQNRTKI